MSFLLDRIARLVIAVMWLVFIPAAIIGAAQVENTRRKQSGKR